MRTSLRPLCLLIFLLIGLLAVDADAAVLRGRVRDTASGAGIPALTVKLSAPRRAAKPQRITTTNQLGDFVFEGVEQGRYMLEIYQGVSLLYREIIDLARDLDKRIDLERRPH